MNKIRRLEPGHEYKASPALVVFTQLQHCISLICEYQVGLYPDLLERFAEESHTILETREFIWCRYLPAGTRPIACAKNGWLILTELCLKPTDKRFPLHVAIACGEHDIVERILRCKPELLTMDGIHCGLKHKQDQVIAYLKRTLCHLNPGSLTKFDEEMTDIAMYSNDLEWIRHLHEEHGLRLLGGNNLYIAAKYGNLELIEYIHSHGTIEMKGSLVSCAAKQRHLHVIDFFLEHYAATYNFDLFIERAGSEGDLAVIDKVIQRFPSMETKQKIFKFAANRGHLHVLEYLHREHEVEPRLESWETVIGGGPASIPVRMGHPKVLKWLIHHCPVEAYERQFIHKCKSIRDKEVMWLLYSIGHPLENLMPGTVEVARFLHEHQVKFSRRHILYAVGYNQDFRIFHEGNLAVVRYMHQIQSTPPFCAADMDAACGAGALDIVEYIHSHITEGCTTQAMDLAIYYGHIDIVRFLHANRTEGCSKSAIQYARIDSREDTVRFLQQNYPDDFWDV